MLKENILHALEQARGEDLSGQALAERFGVSRNAVWKAVNALKKDGYDISSATNRGYRLSPGCDRLSAAEISRLLGRKDIPVYAFDTIDSTNNEAKRRLASGEKGSFLVVSEEQTAGRGRSGKSFYSPKSTGLYMSLVLTPEIGLEGAVNITSYAAVCIVKVIRELCGVQCGIKWVNDIFLNGKKVCGILTEAVTDFESGSVASIIVGIGINLRQTGVPDGLQNIVGFLDCEGAVKNPLVAGICRELLLFDGESVDYIADYKRFSVVLGRRVTYQRQGSTVEGVAADIDGQGGLVVALACGKTETLRSGEISLLGIEGIK